MSSPQPSKPSRAGDATGLKPTPQPRQSPGSREPSPGLPAGPMRGPGAYPNRDHSDFIMLNDRGDNRSKPQQSVPGTPGPRNGGKWKPIKYGDGYADNISKSLSPSVPKRPTEGVTPMRAGPEGRGPKKTGLE